MRVFCNGFNLYGQFDQPELILENFTKVFADHAVKDVSVNHSCTVLQTNDFLISYSQNESKYIKNCGEIEQITSNNDRLLVLNKSGKLFQIELINVDLVQEIVNIINSESPKTPEERIIKVSCGSNISVAYSNLGRLFSLNDPPKLIFEKALIIDIKCGREHCILLDELGNVYTFGRGSRGQLGHGRLDDEQSPILVEAISGIKIVQVAAGGWHSCAASKDGDLYTWGWNSNGQLGLEKSGKEKVDFSVMATPQVVDFSDAQRNAVMVACGSRHTIVLLDNNHLHGCGWNKYKQLINDPKENFHAFTYLHDLLDEKVVQLKCGPWNSVVLCE